MEKNNTFGIEIEFEGVYLKELAKSFYKTDLPILYQTFHKEFKPKYDVWYLDSDMTVSRYLNSDFKGGELSSRIFYSIDDCRDEIHDVCSILKDEGAYSSLFCSNHITVDVSQDINSYFYEALCKIIAVYENDITLFYMGDKYFVRKSKEQYAAGMGLRLQKYLDRIKFNDKTHMFEIMSETDSFGIHDGISFYKLPMKGLMEVRYPNGSLDDKVILNYIKFTLQLVKAIRDKKFDLEYLDSLLEEIRNDKDQVLNAFKLVERPELFYEFLELISDDGSFKEQYQKVLATRK